MAKTWQCTQCGWKVEKGLNEIRKDGAPTECEVCENDRFEQVRVTGRVHRAIDGSGETAANQLTRRRALGAVAGGVLVVGGSWWAFGRPTVVETTDVAMENAQFTPRNIRVESGATVVWSNEERSGEGDPITFFLRSATDGWEFQAEVPEGDNTSYTFEESGVYGLYAEGLGQPDLSGMSMKIGVDEPIDDPLGGWF
jgi:plastocyanin